MPLISGTYTALITPFDDHGALNEKGLQDNIERQAIMGVDGVVALGTTGEAPTLTADEKKQVICIAKEALSGRANLMVGTGTNCTKTTIENTQKAQELGADSALLISPYYNKPTQSGLIAHFSAVAKNTDLPIVLYNHPGRTGVNLMVETVKELAQIKNIVGIKECSANFEFLASLCHFVKNERPEFSVMAGDDLLVLPYLSLGAKGVISVASNLIPDVMCELVKTCSQELFYDYLPLLKALCLETNPLPIKKAMELSGFASGPCRLPLTQMIEEHVITLKKQMEPACV